MNLGGSVLNPWIRLPAHAPFLLAEDAPVIEAHNDRRRGEHRFHLETLPEPFLGRADAPVVLLNLNPGFDPSDIGNYATKTRSSMIRQSLTHELAADQAFYFLTDEFEGTGGWHWWHRRLRPLIDAVGLDRVRRGVQVIEYVPYKSQRFYGLPETVPSQRYTFELVRRAVDRGASIVVMRAQGLWMSAVPELSNGEAHELRNKQNVIISPNNCPTGFEELMKRLGALS